jgi:hypothetical protein
MKTTQPPQPSRMRKIVAITTPVLAATALVGLLYYPLAPPSPPRTGYPEGIRISLLPSTFVVETNNSFSFKASGSMDPACNRIVARIDDLSWTKSFTHAEVISGIQSEITPVRPGASRIRFFSCDQREIGDAPFSVVVGPELSTHSGAVRWTLSSGKPIYREDSFYEIPINASSEQQRDSTFIPVTVRDDTTIKLIDRNGQLSKIPPITVHHHTSVSDPVYLPFRIGADYRLVGFTEDGTSTNELLISWATRGPKLSLVAFPDNLKMYSAGISSATVQLYLAEDARRIKPDQKLEVLLTAPPQLKSVPPDRLTLSPADPIGTYRAVAASTVGPWMVRFSEPRSGTVASVQIEVLSTSAFLLTAFLAGLIGVLVARQKKPRLLELLAGGAAGYLLYFGVIAGWLKQLGFAESMLGFVAAIAVGLVGGYMGLGVFRLLALAFQRLF